MIDLRTLQRVLKARFGGVLKSGSHKKNGECCALELLSVCRGIPWTDDPEKVGSWDLRNLNDIGVSDEVRTQHFLPVLALYADSRAWPVERQKQVAANLVVLTVQKIVAELPGLPDEIRAQCLAIGDLESAADAAAEAARYAADAAAEAARYAADYSTEAATEAAEAAAAREKVFITACWVWTKAAHAA